MDNGQSWESVVQKTDSGTASSMVLIGLKPEQDYGVRLVAHNDAGYGLPSDLTAGATLSALPNPPSNLRRQNGPALKDRVTLLWGAATLAYASAPVVTSYVLEQRRIRGEGAEEAGGEWDLWAELPAEDEAEDGGSSARIFEVQGACGGDIRDYRVKAVNTKGSSLPSNVYRFTFASAAPEV